MYAIASSWDPNCRIQSEHPADESQNVVRNGRILGGLEPSRAFGDSRYKWPREVQEVYVPLYPTQECLSLTTRPPIQPKQGLHGAQG